MGYVIPTTTTRSRIRNGSSVSWSCVERRFRWYHLKRVLKKSQIRFWLKKRRKSKTTAITSETFLHHALYVSLLLVYTSTPSYLDRYGKRLGKLEWNINKNLTLKGYY